GYGSGGDVHAPYYVNLMDGLRNAGACFNTALLNRYYAWTSEEENRADHGWWGHWPYSHPEMPVDIALVNGARAGSDTALVVIGRAAGEDRENTLTRGSYYLTDAERAMLDAVTQTFPHTVLVLNIGSIMDLAWTKEYGDRLSAVLIVWQGGMESGNAAADVLYGKVSPCGKLPDTIALRYEDYPGSENFGGRVFNNYAEGIFVGYRYFDRHPEKVLYPFGYGLSYTEFEITPEDFTRSGNRVTVKVSVRNTGSMPGKEVLQLWCHAPEGRLEKPLRVLAAFGKTGELQPGERETLTLTCDEKCFSSYDEAKHAFILEAGEYRFNVNGKDAGSFLSEQEVLVEQCRAICLKSPELKKRILERLPREIPFTGDLGYTLSDVRTEKITLDAFIGQLSDEELEALTRGHGMMGSPLGPAGNAGAFGGVIESLRKKGVPPIITS
ncbi:MAG: glycoside hydrolase family 3 C-terminal domain-containing protein, partial [bacterium]